MKRLLHAVLFLFVTQVSFSQPICGFDDLYQKQLKDPLEAKKLEIVETQIQQYIKLNPILPQPQGLNTALYTIPVVVHVVHTGGAVGTIYNPTDAQILSVITYLNQSYDGTAAGFSGGAGDIQIQFVLAKRDPNCNPTNGIDRVNGNVLPEYTQYGVLRYTGDGVTDFNLKEQSRWDPTRYYNIWLVNKIDGLDGTSGQFIAGYAAFAGSSASVDGTVMLATQMYVGSKVLPHEIGHSLNLYHPFEGSSGNTSCPQNTNCSLSGDRVCDTDPITYNDKNGVTDFSCRTGNNLCTGTPYSANTENNVMNYTNCFTLFTPGQKTRMIAAMSLASRSSLATSTALQTTNSGSVQCGPKINFQFQSATVTETTQFSANCRGYKDYTYNLTIGNNPSVAATATLTIAGTAVANADYQVTTDGNFASPSSIINFPAGSAADQSFTVRIFDDAAIEPEQTIIFGFNVDNGGGNAMKGEAFPVLTIIIKDNDLVPSPAISKGAMIGTSSNNVGEVPFNTKLASKKTTILYRASELLAAGLTPGNITSIGVYLNKNSTRAISNMEISMGQTSLENLVDGSAFGVDVNKVKTLGSYVTANGLNLFTLDVPFAWNGTDNVAVQFCYNNGSASVFEVSDRCVLYSDGGASTQGNIYFANISCPTNYSSISYYSSGFKPVAYFVVGSAGPQVETLQNATGSAYLGPFEEVYFYTNTGNILARIKNLSAFDYGCTQVTIDRAGATSKGFINNIAAQAVADKTVQVVPTNNNPNGAYEITLYYKTAEVDGWKQSTGQTFSSAKILKTPNAISSYTPGQVPQAIVAAGAGTQGFYGSDSTITAGFTTGFSGFAVGTPLIAASQTYTFIGNGLWTNASNWNNNNVPPASLPAGSQIIINPSPDGQCILNISQTVQPGGSFTVSAEKYLVIQGSLNIVK